MAHVRPWVSSKHWDYRHRLTHPDWKIFVSSEIFQKKMKGFMFGFGKKIATLCFRVIIPELRRQR
jgi:hypothetical protein